MNLNVNNIGFNGKKEVLYELTKSAKISQSMELNKVAYITSRMGMPMYEETAANEASINAYLDMVLRDEAFEKTIKELKPSELYKLHEILMPIKTEHGLVTPMNTFKTTINSIVKNIVFAKTSIKNSVSELYKKLEL